MRTVLLLLALTGLASAAAAQDATVSLPLLTGGYDAGDVLPNDSPASRSCTFTMPPEVVSVSTMRLALSGASTDGAYITEREVGGTVVRDTLSYPGSLLLTLAAPSLQGDTFYAVLGLPEEGVEDAVAFFQTSGGGGLPAFDLLLGATIEAELTLRPAVTAGHWIDPLAVVTGVHLWIEGQTVPAEHRSWGGIKGLFR
jgi:hypothetical protein